MSDLVEFLLARIAEDEERAGKRLIRAQQNHQTLRDLRFLGREIPGWHDWPDLERDAAQALVECEVKRKLIERKARKATPPQLGPAPDYYPIEKPETNTLRILALSYATHPAYREEWRPAG